jgi:hypothetical protein
MKAAYIAIGIAVVVSGCSRRDPIDRLMARLPEEGFTSYMYRPIQLRETASPRECISALTNAESFVNPTVLEIRQVHDRDQTDYTAVLVNTSTGRKIVLLRAERGVKNKWEGWYFKIYDAN